MNNQTPPPSSNQPNLAGVRSQITRREHASTQNREATANAFAQYALPTPSTDNSVVRYMSAYITTPDAVTPHTLPPYSTGEMIFNFGLADSSMSKDHESFQTYIFLQLYWQPNTKVWIAKPIAGDAKGEYTGSEWALEPNQRFKFYIESVNKDDKANNCKEWVVILDDDHKTKGHSSFTLNVSADKWMTNVIGAWGIVQEGTMCNQLPKNKYLLLDNISLSSFVDIDDIQPTWEYVSGDRCNLMVKKWENPDDFSNNLIVEWNS